MQDSNVLAELDKKVAVMENEQSHLDEARKTLESRIFEEFAKTNALIAKSTTDLAARIDKVETRIDKLEEKVSSVNWSLQRIQGGLVLAAALTAVAVWFLNWSLKTAVSAGIQESMQKVQTVPAAPAPAKPTP